MTETIVEKVARVISSPELWDGQGKYKYGEKWVEIGRARAMEKARKAIEAYEAAKGETK